MNTKILRIVLACGALFTLGSSLVLAKESISFEKATFTGGEQRKETPKPSLPLLSTDNLLEFTQIKNAEISTFKKQKLDEIKHKVEEVRTQRKTCQTNLKALSSSRKTARLDLIKDCKPTFEGEPTTDEERSLRIQQIKDAKAACKVKLKEFEQETKQEVTNLRSSCFTSERKVLGLSTLIPYNQE